MPGTPITPGMVLRTLAAMHDAGMIESILAIVVHPDGWEQKVSYQMSNMTYVQVLGHIEFFKLQHFLSNVGPHLIGPELGRQARQRMLNAISGNDPEYLQGMIEYSQQVHDTMDAIQETQRLTWQDRPPEG